MAILPLTLKKASKKCAPLKKGPLCNKPKNWHSTKIMKDQDTNRPKEFEARGFGTFVRKNDIFFLIEHLANTPIGGNARSLLTKLIWLQNGRTGQCNITDGQLAQCVGISTRTVSRIFKKLNDKIPGLILRESYWPDNKNISSERRQVFLNLPLLLDYCLEMIPEEYDKFLERLQKDEGLNAAIELMYEKPNNNDVTDIVSDNIKSSSSCIMDLKDIRSIVKRPSVEDESFGLISTPKPQIIQEEENVKIYMDHRIDGDNASCGVELDDPSGCEEEDICKNDSLEKSIVTKEEDPPAKPLLPMPSNWGLGEEAWRKIAALRVTLEDPPPKEEPKPKIIYEDEDEEEDTRTFFETLSPEEQDKYTLRMKEDIAKISERIRKENELKNSVVPVDNEIESKPQAPVLKNTKRFVPDHLTPGFNERQPPSPAQLRQRWISDIPKNYPTILQKVVERQGVPLDKIQYRMWLNPKYNPLENKHQVWDTECHSDYAVMGEDDRDLEFIKALEKWMWPRPPRYTKSDLTMFKNTRKRADSVRAKYYDYVAAQYDCFGCREVVFQQICCKVGDEIYKEWVSNGKIYPTNHGNVKEQNRRSAERAQMLKSPPVKKRHRKTEEEKINEQREMIPAGEYEL